MHLARSYSFLGSFAYSAPHASGEWETGYDCFCKRCVRMPCAFLFSLGLVKMAARAITSGSSGNKKDIKVNDVEGYIHEVSEVKIPAWGSRYFDFKIQEREENRRVVCFSPDKRDGMKEKEISKSPVRLLSLSPQKRKYEPDSTEYKYTNYSKVMVTKNLAFPWKGIPGAEKEVSVKEILDCSTGDVVSLKAKVVSKGDTQTIYSSAMRKELSKCDIVVADATGAIPATVWEEMIPKICNEKSYVFSKLRVSFFRRKYLNGTKDSIVNDCEDQVALSTEISTAAEQLKPKQKETEDVDGKILAIDVSKFYVCINCKNRIAGDNDANGSEFVACSYCKLSMLKQNMTSTVSANLIVEQDGQNMGRFYCSGAVLNAMFTSVSETENYNIEETNVTQLSRKMITETLLLIKKVSFKISKEDKIIVSMKVSE